LTDDAHYIIREEAIRNSEISCYDVAKVVNILLPERLSGKPSMALIASKRCGSNVPCAANFASMAWAGSPGIMRGIKKLSVSAAQSVRTRKPKPPQEIAHRRGLYV